MLAAGINGSPNAQGSTGTLIQEVLKGYRSKGGDSIVFNLGDMDIHPCKACMSCKKGTLCVIEDDMQEFYGKSADIDALVLGSPVYLDHVSAQLKIFMDRLYCFLSPNTYPGGTKAVVCITYGAGGENSYDYILEWIRERLSYYFGIETVGMLKKAACSGRSSVEGDAGLMQRAFELGTQLYRE